MIKDGIKYLVTTDNWFIAPDGEQYRSVWGECKIIKTTEGLGFNPARQTNWFLQVGTNENHVMVAGCQVHYAVACINKPIIKEGTYTDERTKEELKLSRIYIP